MLETKVVCLCCARLVTCTSPDPEDDAAWAELAKEHAEMCRWLRTRAYRLDDWITEQGVG